MNVNELLEENAPLFGLRKTIRPDGTWFWRESHGKTEIGFREALYPKDVSSIASAIGMGAVILSLGNVDYTIGALQTGKMAKSIWLLDGRRIDITLSPDGIFASVTNEADLNKPEPAFIDRRAQKPSGIRKCLHPDCEKMVDISKKKSGCCCKEHMSFECTHEACVIRAEKNGWKKATHPFGTKIAKEHWKYRIVL